MLPLTGVKVIEFAAGDAGPYCGMVLADLGAEVIKVERIGGDSDRDLGPVWRAAQFVAYNRNKKSVAVDLESERGKEAVLKLLGSSDVLLDSMGVGVLDALGLSHEAVSKLNPKLVYCSITGYGEGPYGNRPGVEPIIESESGFMQAIGETEPQQPLTAGYPPIRLGSPIIPCGAGMYGVLAVMGALLNRRRTGRGEYIRIGLFETAVALLQQHIAGFSVSKRFGKHSADLYKTSDGGWVHGKYVDTNDDYWRRFCEVFGISKEDLAETATEEKRKANPRKVEEIKKAGFLSVTAAESMKKILDGRLVAGTVITIKDVIEDPHVKATKQLIPLIPDPEVTGSEKPALCPMLPIRTNDYNLDAAAKWTAAPRLGEHTAEVLRKLGYTDEQITNLRKSKVIA